LTPPVNLRARPAHKSSMDSLKAFFLRKAYKKIQKLGDRLAQIEPLID